MLPCALLLLAAGNNNQGGFGSGAQCGETSGAEGKIEALGGLCSAAGAIKTLSGRSDEAQGGISRRMTPVALWLLRAAGSKAFCGPGASLDHLSTRCAEPQGCWRPLSLTRLSCLLLGLEAHL